MKSSSLAALLATAALSLSSPLYAEAESDYLHLNKTIQTLSEGKPVFGVFSGDFSLANARALATSDLDYIFIDMEHTPMDMPTLQTFLLGMTNKEAVARNGHAQMEVTPLVRIPMNGRENLQWQVKQVLDAGAYGVVFPYVETKEQAENAIRAMRYPQARGDAAMKPEGLRGLSPGIPSWFWGARDYVSRADVWPLDPKGDLLAVIQIESKEGVDNIEEIASVPGIGAIFIGPADLSMSLGVPFQNNHPDMQKAMNKVLSVCKKRNIPCGLTTNSGTVADYLDQGYSFVTVGYWNDAGISGEPDKALGIAREAAGRAN
ncbi:aldolase [Proteobacteria bacterium 005FR1]|nr:aldolase [Proteobacteria bacterium 005FR1]